MCRLSLDIEKGKVWKQIIGCLNNFDRDRRRVNPDPLGRFHQRLDISQGSSDQVTDNGHDKRNKRCGRKRSEQKAERRKKNQHQHDIKDGKHKQGPGKSLEIQRKHFLKQKKRDRGEDGLNDAGCHNKTGNSKKFAYEIVSAGNRPRKNHVDSPFIQILCHKVHPDKKNQQQSGKRHSGKCDIHRHLADLAHRHLREKEIDNQHQKGQKSDTIYRSVPDSFLESDDRNREKGIHDLHHLLVTSLFDFEQKPVLQGLAWLKKIPQLASHAQHAADKYPHLVAKPFHVIEYVG